MSKIMFCYPCYVNQGPGMKLKSHLRAEAGLVMFEAVRIIQRHHVVPHFDQQLDGAEAGGKPAGVMLNLEILANTHAELG